MAKIKRLRLVADSALLRRRCPIAVDPSSSSSSSSSSFSFLFALWRRRLEQRRSAEIHRRGAVVKSVLKALEVVVDAAAARDRKGEDLRRSASLRRSLALWRERTRDRLRREEEEEVERGVMVRTCFIRWKLLVRTKKRYDVSFGFD